MRKEITHVSPLRLGLLQAAVIAVLYLAMGILGLAFGTMGGMFAGMMGGFHEGMQGGAAYGMFAGGGLLALVMGMVGGAVFGFVGGAIMALVYNIAAGIFGGVVIELKDV